MREMILDLSNLKLKFDIKNNIKNYKYIFLKNNKINYFEIYNNPKILWIDINNTNCKRCYINLINCEFLDISNNSLLDLKIKTPSLKYLNMNNISLNYEIEEINKMKNLQILKMAYNDLTSCNSLELLDQLQIIEINNNKLTDLKFLQKNVNLEKIIANDNQIVEIESIRNLNCLHILNCKNNMIESIPTFLINMTNLKIVNISNNKIRFINNVFKNIRYNLYLYNNPIEYIDEELFNIVNGKNSFVKMKIYDDNQNVHDITIQKSLKRNILVLLNTNKKQYDLNTIIKDCHMNSIEIIINNNILLNEKYIHYDISYFDVLNLIYNKIRDSPHKFEISKLLSLEIIQCENDKLCFIGKISRMINCLSGFFEDIFFELSENDQIFNILNSIKQKYTDIKDIKFFLEKELSERKYSVKIIKDWTDNLEYL